MSFFKKLFGKKLKEEPSVKDQPLPWIEASANPWGIRVLDLRPISQTMISTSTDPQMATNAVSYSGEDGTVFWGVKPLLNRTIPSNIVLPVDGRLAPGVLFTPDTMEHKWAIYFDSEMLIFIRSWLRQVVVVAKTTQQNEQLVIEQITGEFTNEESAAFTNSFLHFLLVSHVLGETIPAPLPGDLADTTNSAGLWAFSAYGNMAHFGVFDETLRAPAGGKLRSHSLLHIAVARADLQEITNQLNNGMPIHALAGDGLAPLHWSIASLSVASLQHLLAAGADPDIRSAQGATPMMNAVQSNKMEHLQILLQSGASVNAIDHRGFTALHRAAEMGHTDIVKLLLQNGADASIQAEGHTALSFAQSRNNLAIIEMLQ